MELLERLKAGLKSLKLKFSKPLKNSFFLPPLLNLTMSEPILPSNWL